jgi:hypothetical protein
MELGRQGLRVTLYERPWPCLKACRKTLPHGVAALDDIADCQMCRVRPAFRRRRRIGRG